jgi:hypothetical protein
MYVYPFSECENEKKISENNDHRYSSYKRCPTPTGFEPVLADFGARVTGHFAKTVGNYSN